MAIPATADWRIRTDGDDLNGAIFARDSGGTDYSDQAAAQASWSTDLSMAGTTTLTDSGSNSLFTAAMVGNGVQINGLFYVVITYTDANNVVVDRSDTFTNQSGKLGGAIHDQSDTFAILNDASATHAKLVAGNRCYIRGSGSNWPTSDDYRLALDIPSMAPNLFSAEIIGYNGRPRIYCTTGGFTQNMRYFRCRNIYWEARGTTNSEIVRVVYNSEFHNCMFNTNWYDLDGVELRDGSYFYGCQFIGTHSNANAVGTLSNSAPKVFYGCYFNPGKSFSQSMSGYQFVIERCHFLQRNTSAYMLYSNLGEDQVIRHNVFRAQGSACDGALYVNGFAVIENNIFLDYTHAAQGAIRLGLSTHERVSIKGNAYYNCTAFTFNSSYDEYHHDPDESNVALTADPFIGVTEITVTDAGYAGDTTPAGTYTIEPATFNGAAVYKRTSPSVLYMFKNDGGYYDGYYCIQDTLETWKQDGSTVNWRSWNTTPGGASFYNGPPNGNVTITADDGDPSLAGTYTKQGSTHNGFAWYSNGTLDIWFDTSWGYWVIMENKPAESVAPDYGGDDDVYYATGFGPTYDAGFSAYAGTPGDDWIVNASGHEDADNAGNYDGYADAAYGLDSLELNDTAGGGADCKLAARPLTIANASDNQDTIGLDIGAVQTAAAAGAGETIFIPKRARRG